MGPSLVDDVYVNKRANTDVGKFEIIHSGAAGAMRSFAKRGLTQDQILQRHRLRELAEEIGRAD